MIYIVGGGFITVNGDTMNFITRYSPPVGIEEHENKTQITVYPNPFTEGLKVSGFKFKVGERI